MHFLPTGRKAVATRPRLSTIAGGRHRSAALAGARAALALAALAAVVALAAVIVPVPAGAQAVGGALPQPLPLFPRDNWWNTDISSAPGDPNSANFISWIGTSRGMHPDFGGDVDPTDPSNPNIYGFPYITVPGSQAPVPVTFVLSADQSDSGAPGHPPGYPIPSQAETQAKWIEGGTPGGGTSQDYHMLIVDTDNRLLYELYQAHWNVDHWEAGSGAIFQLDSDARRPDTWTSADAAGLAILPGLVRYDEAFGSGPILHAFRFTVRDSNGYVYPASHVAGSNTAAPPLGARLRLKASVNLSSYTPEVQRIFQAMKTYGLILADNGSDMYVQGTYDTRWNNDVLNPAFGSLTAGDFEVVQLGFKGPATQAPCAAADTRMCLAGSRFAVSTQYVLPDGTSGPGHVIPLTGDTGAFWFFAGANLEMLLKVLDGCALDNHFWVFAAGLTNAQVVTTVIDTRTGAARRYVNAQGAAFAPLQDTEAFAWP